MFDTRPQTLYLSSFNVHIANTSMIKFPVGVITVSGFGNWSAANLIMCIRVYI